MREMVWLKVAAMAVALWGFASCTSKHVEASGYTNLDLDEHVSLKVPAQFQRVEAALAIQPEERNEWAITHAFAFRENRALLVVSRVADAQSFASAQQYFETGIRYSPQEKWRQARRLDWKTQQLTRKVSWFEAELEPGPKGSNVFVIVDRDALIEAMLIGEREVLSRDAAIAVLRGLKDNYLVKQPLEDYFHEAGKRVQKAAESRRKQYLGLLETLQKEELDYTPTPRVVVFNPNLAGQFWWPMFDRSGVPARFAIAGRLGSVKSDNPAAWKQLESFFPGMRFVESHFSDGSLHWRPIGSPGVLGARTLGLLADSGWAREEGAQAYAALEFSFETPIPDLSQWLTAIEAVGKQAEAQGLVEPRHPL